MSKSNEEKPTVEIAQVPPWAIELTTSVKAMAGAVSTLVEDGKGLNLRVAGIEGRIARLESPTNPPPPPITSVGVRAIIEGHPSQMDLAHEAKLGLALASLSEEKAKREALEAIAVTKADVKALVDDAAREQTSAIVTAVTTLAKTPTAQRLKNALVPVLMLAISIIGLKLAASLSRLEAAQSPAPVQVVQLTPVTVYADAGTK